MKMSPDEQIPVHVDCMQIMCLCDKSDPLHGLKTFITIREWMSHHGHDETEMAQAEDAVARIKEQLLRLDPEFAKDFES